MKQYGRTLVLNISGMSCNNCAATVEQALRGVAGVKEAQVSLDAKTATVNMIPGDMNPESLIHAVKMAGYDARLKD